MFEPMDIFTSNPLPLLRPHLLTLLISTTSFFTIQYLSRRLSPKYFGSRYADFDERTRRGWDSHVVSMAHSLVIVPLALNCLGSVVLKQDPVFGYDPMVGHVLALTSGYFIWDTIDSMINSTIGFVVHGAACLAVFLFSFRPFLAGFGPTFLLWELSTPFLNIHWFMDKLNLSATYPTVHLLNALVFMLVFFLARIVYGGYSTILFFSAMWTERARIPMHLHLIYCVGNIALNVLNWLWFSKMLSKMIARISGDDTPSSKQKPMDEKKEGGTDSETTSEGVESHMRNTRNEMEGETLSLPANPPSPIVYLRAGSEEGEKEDW